MKREMDGKRGVKRGRNGGWRERETERSLLPIKCMKIEETCS